MTFDPGSSRQIRRSPSFHSLRSLYDLIRMKREFAEASLFLHAIFL